MINGNRGKRVRFRLRGLRVCIVPGRERHTVTGDIKASKLDMIQRGEATVQEAALAELLKETVNAGRLRATDRYAWLSDGMVLIDLVHLFAESRSTEISY